MNTRDDKIASFLNPDKEYEIILDGIEMAFEKDKLIRIKEKWNGGMKLVDIAEEEKRQPIEVILALMHLATKRHKLRPLHKVF